MKLKTNTKKATSKRWLSNVYLGTNAFEQDNDHL